MSGVAIHVCDRQDEMGNPPAPEWAQCGICHRAWCDRCDPTPAALCHYCHGSGSTSAPIPPRQLRALRGKDRAVSA